ncbi:MAG: trypsin-like peptidase domain-containing protein [Saprospiraceae bacterium]|nr:trypsin-like peptidase domain-containing protein [Saprospiraceae bacterium]
MKSIIRTTFAVLLLGLGFFAGVAWKNSKVDSTATDGSTLQDTDQVDNPAQAPVFDPGQLPGGLMEEERSTIQLFENSSTSVAFINTTNLRRDYFNRNVMETPRGSGSAFVWDTDGHVVTNYHVIQGADRATVTLANGSVYEAILVGEAPEKDLAVLKIDAPVEELQPIPVGTSSNLRVGQSVYAIGNPFGLDQTLTTGIISALGREIESVSGIPIRDVIQTDAAINPGNSGGPLLNSSGDLIGVNTAIISPSGAYAGIGFSIPVDEVKWVVPDLIQHGRLLRPRLGVEMATQQILQRLGIRQGALVIDVVPNSAAEAAGIRPTSRYSNGSIRLGDLILKLDEFEITSNTDLILAIEHHKAGDIIELLVEREGEQIVIPVTLDEPR